MESSKNDPSTSSREAIEITKFQVSSNVAVLDDVSNDEVCEEATGTIKDDVFTRIIESTEFYSGSESDVWFGTIESTEVSHVVSCQDVFQAYQEEENISSQEQAVPKELDIVIPGQSSKIKNRKDDNKKYYGVSFPENCVDEHKGSLVYESKTDAIKAINMCPGARFKEFSSYHDAVDYASGIVPPSSKEKEKTSFYKAITSNQMACLRKFIEQGDEHKFLEAVYSNPRNLINPAGDGPSILQESSRYNALHIAAKYKKANMSLIILNTIQEEHFLKLTFTDDNEAMLRNRVKRLIDLYLNMPDRALGETPVHFASKYGASEVLSIFLSYHQCDMNKENKYGMTARQMICDRVSHCPVNMKSRMLLIFEDLYYVPVLRDLINYVQGPIIGKQCSSSVVLEAVSSYDAVSVGMSNHCFSGFFGPMTKTKADELYAKFSKKSQFFKDFPFTEEQKKQLFDIYFTDAEKGLERVCRIIAKECDLNWIELWSPISFWGNFHSKEGLNFLEKHLRKQQVLVVNTSVLPTEMNARCDAFLRVINSFVEDFIQSLTNILNQRKLPFFVLFQSLLEYADFMTSKFSFSEDFIYHIHNEIGKLLSLKLKNNELCKEFVLYINKNINTVNSLVHSSFGKSKEKWIIFLCILNSTTYYHSTVSKVLKPPECKCHWNLKDKDFDFSSHQIYYAIVKLRQALDAPKEKEESAKEIIVKSSVTTFTSTLSVTEESKIKPVLLHFQNCNLDYQVTSSEGHTSSHVISRSNSEENINNFLVSIDKFCIKFRDILLTYTVCIPFNQEITLNVFKNILRHFKPIYEFNYDHSSALATFHKEIALTLLSKLQYIDSNVLHKWKMCFQYCDFQLGMSFVDIPTREAWGHLFCVIRQFGILLENISDDTHCSCNFQMRNVSLTEMCNTEFYIVYLKELRSMYGLALKHQMLLPENSSVKNCGTEYFTASETLLSEYKIFIHGKELSTTDIDVYRSIKDTDTEISEVEHKNVLKWMFLIESKLGYYLKPNSNWQSCSSTSIQQAVISKKRKRDLSVESSAASSVSSGGMSSKPSVEQDHLRP